MATCPDAFSSASLDIHPAGAAGACPDRPWLTYASVYASVGPVLVLSAGDLPLLDGCFPSADVLCSTYCSPAVYAATGRDLVVWETALCLLGLLALLATLLVLCAPRQHPGGRMSAVHRQLLGAYCAYYACRTIRLLAWPAVRCLGRSAALSLDAVAELLETVAYSGLFASFLAMSVCLRLRLGRPQPACHSPPRPKRQPVLELLSLVWPLPVAIATGHLACCTLAPNQLDDLPTFEALLRYRPASFYTAAVRIPLAACHLLSMLHGLQSLRLSLRRRLRRRPDQPLHRRRGRRVARWARTLALINALTGAYLILDLVPPGLAADPRALRAAQLAAHLLQTLLVVLPMFWLNRRVRRAAGLRISAKLHSLLAGSPGRPVTATAQQLQQLQQPLLPRPEQQNDQQEQQQQQCPLVTFLRPECRADRLDHIDCEIDS